MIVLGLDFGERRIGVAATDSGGTFASPLTVIERTTRMDDIARIGELAERRRAEAIVMGLPLNIDGSPGPMARRVRRFASALRRELKMEVLLWDERLSTVEADEVLRAVGGKGPDRRAKRDAVAAALILQRYLDSLRHGNDDETEG